MALPLRNVGATSAREWLIDSELPAVKSRINTRMMHKRNDVQRTNGIIKAKGIIKANGRRVRGEWLLPIALRLLAIAIFLRKALYISKIFTTFATAKVFKNSERNRESNIEPHGVAGRGCGDGNHHR